MLVGNWKDETFLQKKSFDLVLADYLLLGVCVVSWCCRFSLFGLCCSSLFDDKDPVVVSKSPLFQIWMFFVHLVKDIVN